MSDSLSYRLKLSGILYYILIEPWKVTNDSLKVFENKKFFCFFFVIFVFQQQFLRFFWNESTYIVKTINFDIADVTLLSSQDLLWFILISINKLFYFLQIEKHCEIIFQKLCLKYVLLSNFFFRKICI